MGSDNVYVLGAVPNASALILRRRNADAWPPPHGPRRRQPRLPPHAAAPGNRSLGGGLSCCLKIEELRDKLLKNWDARSRVLALEEGYFVVQKGGGTWWWDVPTGLDNKVKGRQKSLPKPRYAAIGEGECYFVEYEDGNGHVQGPDPLREALDARRAKVKCLAFALDDGWYVLFEDGSYSWEGIPLSLHRQLNGRQKSLPAADYVAIGPNEEWFVRFEDGDWRCNGISDACSDEIVRLQDWGHTIERVVFGADWT
ncbi:MAG: hypothetical protein J3K34DRAFT_456355 [Monoraphidium minutum]|nr:MAG: hypothetical protein J3K34DRAFT_456355 [Monoraphidium minutum]